MVYKPPGERRRDERVRVSREEMDAATRKSQISRNISDLFAKVRQRGNPGAKPVELIRKVHTGTKLFSRFIDSAHYIGVDDPEYRGLSFVPGNGFAVISPFEVLKVASVTMGWSMPEVTYIPEHGSHGEGHDASWAMGVVTVDGILYTNVSMLSTQDGFAVLDVSSQRKSISALPSTEVNVNSLRNILGE